MDELLARVTAAMDRSELELEEAEVPTEIQPSGPGKEVDEYLIEKLGPHDVFIRLTKEKEPKAFHAITAICAMDEARIPKPIMSQFVDLIDVEFLRRFEFLPFDHGAGLHALAYMMHQHKVSFEQLQAVVNEYPLLDLNNPSVTFAKAVDFINKCIWVARRKASGEEIPEGYMTSILPGEQQTEAEAEVIASPSSGEVKDVPPPQPKKVSVSLVIEFGVAQPISDLSCLRSTPYCFFRHGSILMTWRTPRRERSA